MKTLAKEAITSLATIIMVILTIGIFIYYHARALFYIMAAISIAIGVLNIWYIELAERKSNKAQGKTKIAASKRRK